MGLELDWHGERAYSTTKCYPGEVGRFGRPSLGKPAAIGLVTWSALVPDDGAELKETALKILKREIVGKAAALGAASAAALTVARTPARRTPAPYIARAVTTWWRSRLVQYTHESTARIGDFVDLEPQQHAPLRRHLRRLFWRIAPVEVIRDLSEVLFRAITLLTLTTFAIAWPIASALSNPPVSDGGRLAALTVFATALSWVGLALCLQVFRLHTFLRQRWVLLIGILLVAAASSAAQYLLGSDGLFVVAHGSVNGLRWSFGISAVVVASGLLVAMVIGVAHGAVGICLNRHLRINHPGAVVCDQLVEVIALLDRWSPAYLDDAELRHRVGLALGKAANVLERDIPMRGDVGSRTLLRERLAVFARRAAWLRRQAVCVLEGDPTSLATTRSKLVRALASAAINDWSHFPSLSEPPPSAADLRLTTRIASAAKASVVPILGLVGLHYLRPDTGLNGPLEGILGLWLLASLLPIIDPTGDKQAVMRDLLQYVRVDRPKPDDDDDHDDHTHRDDCDDDDSHDRC